MPGGVNIEPYVAETGDGSLGTLNLERVMPALAAHLGPKEWLACFQTGKSLSELVLQHATRTHLMLDLGEPGESPGANSNSMGGNSTGGNSTGGNSTGGNSTGGNSTGGNSTGGNSTGGNSTGGNSTGGNSTGGNSTGGNSTGGGSGKGGGGSNSGGTDGSGKGGGGSSSSSKGKAGPNALVAQQLAAPAADVALTLRRGLLTPDKCLKGSITSVRLQRVHLPAHDIIASTLQLHALPRLHTLSLDTCLAEPAPTSANPTPTSTEPATTSNHPTRTQSASSVRTLSCMNGSVPGKQEAASCLSCLPLALSLMDPAQLQTVTTDDVAGLLDHMRHMPALEDLKLLNKLSDAERVFTALRDGSLAHPGLKRLTLGRLNLRFPCFIDSAILPDSLESLHLPHGAGTGLLACLPLSSLRSLIVNGRIHVEYGPVRDGFNVYDKKSLRRVAKAIENIKSCAHVAFQPNPDFVGRHGFTQPAFILDLTNNLRLVTDWEEPDHPPEVPGFAELASLCISRIVGGGAFILAGAPVSPKVLLSLSDAPPTVNTIGFSMCMPPNWLPPEHVGVVDSLPAHVSHVLLADEVPLCGGNGYWTSRVLPFYMRGVDRPLRLTLIWVGDSLLGHTWHEYAMDPARRWLAEHAGSQVQVEFRN